MICQVHIEFNFITLIQDQWSSATMLWYRRLPVDKFTDTMFSSVKSKCHDTCAQVFSTANGWTRAYPMGKKFQSHEALSLLFQHKGVPNVMIMDGSKEQLLAQFQHKCWQASVHVKQTEPYSQWQNATKGAILWIKET
jgi:hypothetical protein